MTKVYFYPKIELKPNDTQNSYADDFENALSHYHEVLNKEVNTKGVLDFFKYLGKVDVFILNWIEDIPRRKYGKLQVVVFLIFLALKRVYGFKMVWVLHNKYSHNLAKNLWTDLMFKQMIKNSDLILTHSSEGIEFVKKKYPKHADKVKYEIHPIKQRFDSQTAKKTYDFLFWGAIHPYKNIIAFLDFIKKRETIPPKKILIIGHCSDEDYRNQLISYVDDNISFENKFFEMNEIAYFASQSRFTLFTYKADSVLSSGALMDTIRMNSEIIGPNHGAFKDLSFLSSMHTFDTFEDIIEIYRNGVANQDLGHKNQGLTSFFEENSWSRFSNRIRNHIDELLHNR